MRRRIKEAVFAAQRTRGNLLTVQFLANFGEFARIAPRPNRRKRCAPCSRRVGRFSGRFTWRIGHEAYLAVRANCKARSIFCTAKRTVHGETKSTIRRRLASTVLTCPAAGGGPGEWRLRDVLPATYLAWLRRRAALRVCRDSAERDAVLRGSRFITRSRACERRREGRRSGEVRPR